MKRFAWLIFGCLMLSTAHAASFDCARAGTKVEKMICGSAEVSKLDEELASAYKTALQDMSHAEDTRQNQKKWLNGRNRCADVACLKTAYAERIADLSLGMKAELVAGKGNPVCTEISLGDVSHADFNLMHALIQYEPSLYISDGLAKLNLNNDGDAVNVVRISLSSGRCESSYLAVTDDSRTRVPDSKLNDVLRELGTCGGGSMEPFTLHGITYLDVRDQEGSRTIYKIAKDASEVVCKFQNYTSFSEGAGE